MSAEAWSKREIDTVIGWLLSASRVVCADSPTAAPLLRGWLPQQAAGAERQPPDS